MAGAQAPDFKVNQTVLFQGYAQLEEGQEPVLNPGERVKITKIDGDVFIIHSVERTGDGGAAVADSAFADELAATGDEADLPPAEEPKGKGGKAGKAKAGKGGGKSAAQAFADDAAAQSAAGEESQLGTDTEAETTDEAPAETAPKSGKGAGRNATKAAAKAAKTETTPSQAPAAEFAPIQITDSDSVIATLTANEDAVEAAKALVEQGEKTDYTLGGVLYHIYSQGIFKGVIGPKGQAYEGKRGFSDFVEQHLNVAYRKAMYLISIYTTFRRLNIDESRIAAMGWAKAKELVRIAKKKDADGVEIGFDELARDFDELAEFAEKNTRDALTARINTKYLDGRVDSEGRTKAMSFKFVLSGEAADTVTAALEQAKAQTEGDLNAAFEKIVGEWSITAADLTLDQVIAQVQNRFGVRLTATEAEVDAPSQEEMFQS